MPVREERRPPRSPAEAFPLYPGISAGGRSLAAAPAAEAAPGELSAAEQSPSTLNGVS